MKAVLTFDLSNPEDAEEFRRVCKSGPLCHCLSDILEHLRQLYKNGSEMVDVYKLRGRVYEIMEDHGIVLDELWS